MLREVRLSLYWLRMSQSGAVQKCSTDCRVEKCDKPKEEEERPVAIGLYRNPVLLHFQNLNDIASIHYFALVSFRLLQLKRVMIEKKH